MPSRARRLTTLSVVALAGALAACGGDDADPVSVPPSATTPVTSGPAPSSSSDPAPPPAGACVVWLHGRGDRGSPTRVDGDVTYVNPSGNGEWEGARQWLYASPADLAAATESVTEAVDSASCERVVVHGFSNGGAFAAKLYCSGDDLGGRLRGVVIDDPVTDASADACAPSDGVDAVLYWTTALEWATAGTSCDEIGWTCEGPTIVGVEAYAEALGLPITPSIHTEHVPFTDPPETASWLAGG